MAVAVLGAAGFRKMSHRAPYNCGTGEGKYDLALAMGLRAQEALRTLPLASASTEALRYLKGETLEITAEQIRRNPIAPEDMPLKGYVLVCIDGYPAGWGKWDGSVLKNELAAGWRWT